MKRFTSWWRPYRPMSRDHAAANAERPAHRILRKTVSRFSSRTIVGAAMGDPAPNREDQLATHNHDGGDIDASGSLHARDQILGLDLIMPHKPRMMASYPMWQWCGSIT
jgi:hypothetical protein